MPAIRDYSFNYTTSTTGTTVAVDMPDSQLGDILVAVLSADTGTLTWSSAGWTSGGAFTNTTNIAILWKAALATEAASYTFTASAGETLNGAIVSIKDADTTTAIANIIAANRTTASQTFPSTTATRNNSLILYASSHGSTGVIPTALEGPVSYLFAKDGSAHSDSLSWGFKTTAGATGSLVTSSVAGATFNGSLVTVVINPPVAGAQVIPAYSAQDLSKYVDPLFGTTAFRSNTAPAGTATTSFTGTIGGRALANATVAAQADKGINTYRSCAGHTSSIDRTWQGMRLAINPILTTAANKNILCHVMPNIPAEMQTLEPYSLNRGVAMGCYSAAGAFKVWHVHGSNTFWGSKMVPVVINTAATAGVIQTTGSLNTNSIAGFGFFSSGFVTSADMVWTQLWVLDTTTICGGTTSIPVTVSDITKVIADGYERISALTQGSSQLLSLQPFQLGNGTSSTVVNLRTAAIEFAGQYNAATGQVFYNSTDNVAGVSFFPSATDTIDIRSSVFSSSSKFHWRWLAGSSSSASILTSGCQVINAGDVQLRTGLTFNNMTFDTCTTIVQNSATLTSNIFDSSLLQSNNPAVITSCSFISAGTGHAIEITTPGTYSFTGNIFTGYGAIGTTNAAIYNNSGGAVVINVSGGGSTPTYRNGTAATTTVNASAAVTLTDLVAGTEVRAYLGTDPATATEIAGIESSGTSFNFNQSVAGQAGYIQIFNVAYQPVRLSIIYSSSDVSIPIQQITDRNYQP